MAQARSPASRMRASRSCSSSASGVVWRSGHDGAADARLDGADQPAAAGRRPRGRPAPGRRTWSCRSCRSRPPPAGRGRGGRRARRRRAPWRGGRRGRRPAAPARRAGARPCSAAAPRATASAAKSWPSARAPRRAQKSAPGPASWARCTTVAMGVAAASSAGRDGAATTRPPGPPSISSWRVMRARTLTRGRGRPSGGDVQRLQGESGDLLERGRRHLAAVVAPAGLVDDHRDDQLGVVRRERSPRTRTCRASCCTPRSRGRSCWRCRSCRPPRSPRPGRGSRCRRARRPRAACGRATRAVRGVMICRPSGWSTSAPPTLSTTCGVTRPSAVGDGGVRAGELGQRHADALPDRDVDDRRPRPALDRQHQALHLAGVVDAGARAEAEAVDPRLAGAPTRRARRSAPCRRCSSCGEDLRGGHRHGRPLVGVVAACGRSG